MNQNTKHTPGPWEIIGEQGTCIWKEERILASVNDARREQAVARANARRIVACVNALEGVSTEDLESGAFKKEIARTLEERDELREHIYCLENDPSSKGWIRVNDRLPDNSVSVFVNSPLWSHPLVGFRNLGKWYSMPNQTSFREFPPTCWMPINLPAAPKHEGSPQ